MRAIGLMRFGGPEVLRPINIPLPEPGPGEVRIRVHAAAVNPTDAIFRAGDGQARVLGDRPPPFVPGMDAAGIIDKIGPKNDGRLAVGDPVIALVLPAGPRGGAYADQLVVTAAATLPLNGLTARVVLDTLALTTGQTVAVTGSAGALGGYVIQIAKADGLTVVADAAPADTELIRSLGADVVVPRGESVAAAIRAAVPAGVNGLVDAANQQAGSSAASPTLAGSPKYAAGWDPASGILPFTPSLQTQWPVTPDASNRFATWPNEAR